MSDRVALITDSAASLPDDVVSERDITVVALQVRVGSESLEEGRGSTQRIVTKALRESMAASTSRPSPATFAAAYAAAVEAGATAIVSVHLSAQVSGTYASALVAAADAGVPVEVVDSGQVGLGTGFAVLAAADALERGADAPAAAAAAAERATATSSFFYVDTLEHLRRGGRIGAAAAWFGAALAVKPLLTVRSGRVEPLEKVRTAGRALARIEELAVAAAGDGPVDVGVQHLGVQERAATLAERLRTRLPHAELLWEREVSPAVGVHVGPGAVAVVIARHRP
jgi:DegV family protein with EDD domain